MTEKEFFHKWIGKVIEFTDPNEQSAWKLEAKYSDKNDQSTAEAYNQVDIDPVDYGAPSGAYGTFRCRRTDEPHDVAAIRVIMQIPYAGSEYAVYAERTRQATDVLTGIASSEIKMLQALRQNQVEATPAIRAFEALQQADDGLVPRGFLYYILMDHATGIQLKHETFWSFDFDDRDRIRQAFRVAWLECLGAGVYPTQDDPSHLFWDSRSSKILIAGFRRSQPAEPGNKWTDIEWLIWGLAKCPRTYQEALENPTKDDWTL